MRHRRVFLWSVCIVCVVVLYLAGGCSGGPSSVGPSEPTSSATSATSGDATTGGLETPADARQAEGVGVAELAAASTVIIDEDRASRVWGGGWHTVTGVGYSNDLKWCATSPFETAGMWWQPPLGRGAYSISAFIPTWSTLRTKSARYDIHCFYGGLHAFLGRIVVDQSTTGGRWVSLGGWACRGTPYVTLGNGTGESGRRVLYDAIRFAPIPSTLCGDGLFATLDRAYADANAGKVYPSSNCLGIVKTWSRREFSAYQPNLTPINAWTFFRDCGVVRDYHAVPSARANAPASAWMFYRFSGYPQGHVGLRGCESDMLQQYGSDGRCIKVNCTTWGTSAEYLGWVDWGDVWKLTNPW